jgi:cell division septum initiation protein DivIVA
MQSTQPTSLAPKRSGLPFWTVMLALLILVGSGVAVIGGIWFYHVRSEARLQAKVQAMEAEKTRAELERERAAGEAKLTMARNRQTEVQAQARQATNLLARLLADTVKVNADALALKSNEAGRLVGQHPDLVASARRFYEIDLRALAAPDDIASRLEAVRRVEQQVSGALGTTYVPDADLAVTAQHPAVWAEQESRRVTLARNLLSALVQEAKVKLPPASATSSPASLQDAINQLAQAESTQRQRLFVEKTDEAKVDAAKTLAQAEAKRISETAQSEAKRMLDEARAEARRLEDETTAKMNAALTENRLMIEKMMAAMTAKTNEQRRATELAQAEQARLEAEKRVREQRIREEARKIELRKKASDPSVRAKIAPFLGPGLWQLRGYSAEPQPLSLTALQSCGAFDPSQSGLQTIIDIATNSRNQDRGRWKMFSEASHWVGRPERQAKIVEAQRLLIELGPIYVEMGLLRE